MGVECDDDGNEEPVEEEILIYDPVPTAAELREVLQRRGRSRPARSPSQQRSDDGAGAGGEPAPPSDAEFEDWLLHAMESGELEATGSDKVLWGSELRESFENKFGAATFGAMSKTGGKSLGGRPKATQRLNEVESAVVTVLAKMVKSGIADGVKKPFPCDK
eukprot:gene22437-53379_t